MIKLILKSGTERTMIRGVKFIDGESLLPMHLEAKAKNLARMYNIELQYPDQDTDSEEVVQIDDEVEADDDVDSVDEIVDPENEF